MVASGHMSSFCYTSGWSYSPLGDWESYRVFLKDYPYGAPVCWLSAHAGNIAITELLADTFQSTNYLLFAACNNTVLHMAALGGHPHVLEFLFTKLDINPSLPVPAMLTKFSTGSAIIKPNPKDMPTLLAVAVISKSEDTVRYLMDKGHTPSVQGSEVYHACYQGSLNILKLLLYYKPIGRGKIREFKYFININI